MATKKPSAKTQTRQESWIAEIAAAEKELKKFHERARVVTKRFLDERDTMSGGLKWFNIFYANTNILESALYSQLPKPSVTRRFKDFDDPVARVAAQMLQRSITQDLDDPRDTFDSTMRHCVQDRLVPGLGQAWLRLENTLETVEDVLPDPNPASEPEVEPEDEGAAETAAEGGQEEQAEPMERITDQRVCVDYVFWQDFLWSPCRVWEERRWTGRKVYMTREKLVKRFGEELGNQIPLDRGTLSVGDGSNMGSTPKDETQTTASIYEIWVREGRKVIWVSKGHTELLDEVDDPLGLTGFEPCPTPMLANLSTSNTTPRPDYYMLQDQYTELDTINNRISKLVQACKVVGVYDKGATGVARMLKEGFDNDLIPVDNWAMFAEKGGIKGQIDWLPVKEVVDALNQLNIAREAIKAQIYELTGISDIVRGATKASETLGAQEIKAKFASVRIKKLQDEVARFAGEILRIKAEIQVKHFEPEILVKNSNMDKTQDASLIPEAIKLLKSEENFEWRIQVTADSIAQADYDMEKKDRIEFLTAVSSYLEKAGQMFQVVPQSATLLVGMLKWAVAGFRNASEIEGMIDKELDAISKNPPQDKPDPEKQKQEAEMQKQQQAAQLAQQQAAHDQQMSQQQAQVDLQKTQMEFQMEQQRLQFEFQLEQQRMQMELNHERQMFELEVKKANLEMEALMQKMQMDRQAQDSKLQHDAAANEQKLTHDAQQGQLQLDLAAKAAEAAPTKESA